MRRLVSAAAFLCLGLNIALAPVGAAVPDFVPQPSDIYERFSAFEEPRSDVPVGALWIQGYGAFGDGAAPDNLATIKSLSGVVMTRELQLGLAAGILNLFGIDPGYKKNISARFSDLTIVKVKDVAKLSGPAGEPRIVEALRAGSITISTDSDISLDLQKRGLPGSFPVTGRTDAGRRKTWTIDGKDMFIAFRVGTLSEVRGEERDFPLRRVGGQLEAKIDEYRVLLDLPQADRCACPSSPQAAGPACPDENKVWIHIGKDELPTPASPGSTAITVSGEESAAPISLALTVPKADGKGGLFTSLSVRIKSASKRSSPEIKVPQCDRTAHRPTQLSAAYEGHRVQILSEPKAPGW